MKKIFTFFFCSLFFQSLLLAAAPTVPASNLSFNNLDGAQMSGSFTIGNGTSRMIVMKKGSPVTGVPVNGTDYTYNGIFGSAASQFTAAGEYVVGKTSWNSFTVTNLEPGIMYYFAIFEYSGTGAGLQYLNLPLTGSQSTVTAPTLQSSAINLTASTGNSLSLNWIKGNGTGRILVARKASAVNASPADLTNYYVDQVFGNGHKLGADNYVVYKGTGNTTLVKNLEPNTEYHFALFEYNGNNSPVHLTPAAIFSATTNAGPTAASTSPGFSYVEGNRFHFSVAYGNGTRRLFIAKKNSPVTASPLNGTSYSANSAFGTAGTEIAPGEFVVGATTGNLVTLTNLEPNTIYHFRVFEYDQDLEGNTYYLTGSYAVKSGSTSTTPTNIASNLALLNLTGSSTSIQFTPGNGNYRMVIIKAGSPVDAVPSDLVSYTPNSAYGGGTQITPGNFVAHWGMNGTQFPLSNLQAGVSYHVAVYEFNGYNYPVYSSAAATFNFTVPSEPGTASSAPWTAFTEGGSFRLIWTNGTGSRRLVVAKKGSAVTSKPVDNSSYTANAAFGLGQELAAGEYVVFDGSYPSVDLINLEIGSTYHFAVFDYNTGAGGPDYLTSSYLVTNASTIAYPTSQVSITGVSNIQATSATINFAKGNGSSRIFIMKEGSAVTAIPQDLVKYGYNPSFGSGGSMGDGNYALVVTSGNGSFNTSNLKANTTYHITAYELNGSSQPAYLLTTPGTYSFTTADVPGATVPTLAATNASTQAVDGNKFTFKWTNGNGEKRIVVMRQGAAVDFMPASETTYSLNTDLGGGQKVIYNGSAASIDLTNLLPSTSYYFAIFEYNGTGSLTRYLTSSFLSATGSTVSAPSIPTGSINALPGNGQATMSWTNGNGNGRLIILKESGSVTAMPVQLSVYTANANFKSGPQVAPGEYVIFAGSAGNVTITGLENKTYHYSIFEYNGSTAPVYQTTPVQGSFTISTTLPVKILSFTAKSINGKGLLQWATSHEVNNDKFIVERSNDGSSFQPITEIDGAGNSSQFIQYQYTDATVSPGIVYYRLKQVDWDGHVDYSIIISIEVKKKPKFFSIYPNPVQGQVYIDMPLPASGALLNIYNSNGVLILKKKIVEGEKIMTNQWKTGVYYFQLEVDGERYQTTVVK